MRRFISILALIVILGVSFTSCKQKKRKVVKKVKKVAVIEHDTIQPDSVTYEDKSEPVVEPVSVPNKYFLIAASFESKKNAEEMLNKLTDLGYSSRIFISEDNDYRVSYMGFSDREEAFKKLAEERAKADTENVWIHIPKINE